MKTKTVSYTIETLPPLSAEQEAQLRGLAARPDHEIDLSDVPEVTEEQFRHGRRGAFYRPVNRQVIVAMDADHSRT